MYPYAEPEFVTEREGCNFYHHMDLPGFGEVGRGWDLRPTIDAYLGKFDYAGKRALDVGTASGYLTFEMEKRGATVVSFDMPSGDHWNIVPYDLPGFDPAAMRAGYTTNYNAIRRGYWLAHGAMKSKARVFYGDVYNISDAIGQFDVVLVAMILSHLRDPFQAIVSAARRSDEWMIITNQAFPSPRPMCVFLATPERKPNEYGTYGGWWGLSDGFLRNALQILGFTIEAEYRERHLFTGSEQRGGPNEECLTLVARRRRKPS